MAVKLFMIRWPNGDTSLVGAPNEDEVLLYADDTWADPFSGEITELERVALDLKPKIEDGRLGFDVDCLPDGGDDERFDFVRKAYPLIEKLVQREEGEPTAEAMEVALADEIDRVKDDDRDGEADDRSPLEKQAGWVKNSGMNQIYANLAGAMEEGPDRTAPPPTPPDPARPRHRHKSK
jgi:hypothetical protein